MTSSKKDKYGQTLGRVTLDGKDIGQEQSIAAWRGSIGRIRLNCPKHAAVYELGEVRAKAEKRGLWADASPMPPWDFRSGKTAKAPGATPPTTTAAGPIIGNRNSKIYHMSNCPDYGKVSERNRVPFKTEAEAQAAGYRKARNCP